MKDLSYSGVVKTCSCGRAVKSCKETGIGITFQANKKIEWFNCNCHSTLVHITEIPKDNEPKIDMIVNCLIDKANNKVIHKRIR